jgi:hypothetical protein
MYSRWCYQNNVDIRPQIFQNVLGRCYIELDVLKAFVLPEPFRPVTHYISLQFIIPACARDKWILGASNALALGEPVCGFFPAAVFDNFGEQNMTESLDQNVDMLRSVAPLLITESADEFASLRKALKSEIKPEGAIEQMYVDDFATLIWEIRRLRRYKTFIINNGRLAALRGILEQLLCRRDYDGTYDHEHAAEDLARSWFDDKKAQTSVAKLLRQFQMDEGAIEAEAFRLQGEGLERLDRILTKSESRRDKALRCIADYRQSLAKQIKQSTDRILDNDDVPRLVAMAKRSD